MSAPARIGPVPVNRWTVGSAIAVVVVMMFGSCGASEPDGTPAQLAAPVPTSVPTTSPYLRPTPSPTPAPVLVAPTSAPARATTRAVPTTTKAPATRAVPLVDPNASSSGSSSSRSGSSSSSGGSSSGGGSVRYKNCAEARAAGAAPIRRGQPGYASHLDRDNDGVACE